MKIFLCVLFLDFIALVCVGRPVDDTIETVARYNNLPQAALAKILGFNNPVQHVSTAVSKLTADAHIEQFKLSDTALLKQYVESPPIAQSAMDEGTDRRSLLLMALIQDNLEVVKYLITPPDTKEPNWPAAEIQWLKEVRTTCDYAESLEALRILYHARFYCYGKKAMIKAINEDDYNRVRVVSGRGYYYDFDEDIAVALGDITDLRILQPFQKPLEDRIFKINLLCRCAADKGNIAVLEWIHNTLGGCQYAGVFRWALLKSQTGVVAWAERKGLEFKTEQRSNRPALSGHLELLIWQKAKGVRFDENICLFAAQGGHLDILKWAHAEGLPCSRPDIIFEAKINGQEHVVDWALAIGIPAFISEMNCERAGKKDALDVLQWYFDRNAKCKAATLELAFTYGFLRILEWALSQNIEYVPSDDALRAAAEKGSLETLKWARARGYASKQNILSMVAMEGCFGVVKWIFDESKDPTSKSKLMQRVLDVVPKSSACHHDQTIGVIDMMKFAVENGAALSPNNTYDAIAWQKPQAVIRWLINEGQPLEQKSLSLLAENGKLQALKFAVEKGAILGPETYKAALLNGQFRVLNWLVLQDRSWEYIESVLLPYHLLECKHHWCDVIKAWAKFKAAELNQPAIIWRPMTWRNMFGFYN